MKLTAFCSTILAALLLATPFCDAQEATQTNDPSVAYEQARRPFEITRAASQNWSDVERAAFVDAQKRAKASCLVIKADELVQEQYVAYARLCAFGEQWEMAVRAADRYLSQNVTTDKLRSMAFDIKVLAELRLQQPDAAYNSCQALLKSVPYDANGAEALNAAIAYMKFSDPTAALALLTTRQPILLAKIRAASSAEPTELSLPELYAEAIAMPTMLQYLKQADTAQHWFEELQVHLPAKISPQDAYNIAQYRSRYELLGAPLPAITTATWLMDPDHKGIGPNLKKRGAITALFLFPDWCIQCAALRPQLIGAWQRLNAQDGRFFTLLAQDDITTPVHGAKAKKENQPNLILGENGARPRINVNLGGDNRPMILLLGTPTFLVPTETLSKFFTAQVPVLIFTDRNGIVRVVEAADDSYLAPGGVVDQIYRNINELWP